MNGFSFRLFAGVSLLLVLPALSKAQAPQQAGTLVIAGQTEHAPLVRINGKSYVDVESLARMTQGTLRFQGNQTILTLPGNGGAVTAAAKPAGLSEGFLNAEIEALTQIREWRADIVNAVENNYPVAASWVDPLRRSTEAKVQLAVAAAHTDQDQKAAELLRNEFSNMQQMSDQFVAIHAKVSYTSPDSIENNALDQKVLGCERALAAMAATKQFADDAACR